MKCIICNAESSYYFTKTYSKAPFDEFMKDIGPVDYYKCSRCGFVLSKAHQSLDKGQWDKLNHQFHHYIEGSVGGHDLNQPPYAEQALMLRLLGDNGVVRTDSMIDYAAGYGSLSRILEKYFNASLPIYDPYVKAGDEQRYVQDLSTYKTVLNSAMFEHVVDRESLDYVDSLVDDDGCFIIHTLVCENVPKDPDWFYLEPPVHTAFHTNASMNILMEQWGYRSSIYCPQSKCWILMREDVGAYSEKLESINEELQCQWFFYKNGFVDYWKGF